MINKIEMYTAVCDGCKETHELHDGCIALTEKDDVRDCIRESGEWAITTEGKVYCSDCHQSGWDDKKDEMHLFTPNGHKDGVTFLGIEDC